ncbi:putative lysine transport system permease protein [Olsenella sp. KH3B4]|uniref:amino acid ABC transporter permease n=1 Tax=Olsenella sp. KH3B4 TaxID=1855394 RepID=UPI0008B8F99B|nr:amino acid ABC transporter permease [Olsenella sp. KH3B4]SET26605.1 putative lysine transport system permease protein [Olsenella sp. KH3B4]
MSDAPSISASTRRARFAAWLHRDHRYVLLGTSAVAFVGMWLSSQPRPALSFLAHAFTAELVMYYVLAAWLVLSAVALVFKLTHWNTYAQVAPFVKPGVRRTLRLGSYVIWALAIVLFVDRAVMGFASAWAAASASAGMPQNDMLTQILYMFQQGYATYLQGILTTIELAVFGTAIAFVLAMLLVFVRIQHIDRPDNDFVRFWKKVGVGFAKVYSTVVRGTPMLVQGVIIYYAGFGLFSGSGMSVSEINAVWSRFIAGLVVISLNSTAYMMEVLRGGIESVDKGQMEAARSLGLSQWQAMVKVVFPQGIRYAIPGLSNELVINIKDSSVLSVIGVFDLAFAASTIAGIYYKQLNAYLVIAVFYLIMTATASWLLGKLAKRLDAKTEPVLGVSNQMKAGGEK